jgi:uncharacterized repeat protein (TIGR01451 family)/LPXTG-motif cell wall-anchored protein
MFKSVRLRRKFVALFALFSLTLNIFQPVILAAPVYASEIGSESSSPEPTPSVEPAPVESTPTPAPTLAPDPSVSPSPEPSATTDLSPSPSPTVIPSPSTIATPTPTADTPVNPEPSTDSSPSPPTSSPTSTPTTNNLDEELHIAVIEHTEATSIDEIDLTVTETGSAQLATDKLDYAPTDTALITGNGFLPNAEYTLTISSSDEPATSTTVTVDTDDEGILFYAYQLDGIYRPNYRVEARDSLGNIVATITFTDNRDFATVTVNGGSSTIVAPSGTVTVSANVSTDGSDDDWQSTAYIIEGQAQVCDNTPSLNSDGSQTTSFNLTAPATTNTYDLTVTAYANNNCAGSSDTLTLTNAITVASPVTPGTIPFSETFGASNNAVVTNWNETEPAEIISGSGEDAPTSTQFAKISDGGWICKPINATGSSYLELSYSWKGDSDAEDEDSGIVEYKVGGNCSDGSGWTNIASHDLDDESWDQATHDLPAGVNNTTFNLRFRTDASSSSEAFRVDSISIVSNPPVSNPSLNATCGLDIALVIDNSTSIDSGEMTSMKNAITAFVTALSGTPTHYSVSRFATTASVVQAFTGNTADVNNAINAIPVGGGYTNWEDGLLKGQSTLPHRSNPNLVIFASDGNPNTIGNGPADNASPDGSPAAMNPAITVANAIKSSGARMLAIGIGNDLNTANLQAIAGPNTNTGNILTSDVITTDFNTLAGQLNTFASQSCGGTVTVTKKIDADGNLGTTGDQTVASGWTFNVGGQADKVTDGNGQTSAVTLVAGSNYSVTETQQNNYSLLQASCTGATNNGTSNLGNNNISGIQIDNTDIVSCTFINTPPVETVDICHATGSHGNPYITNSPSKSGDVSGHDDHNGPTWFPGIAVTWGDIIPPFTYPGGSYPGQNWDTAGQAIYNNSCNVPNGTLTVTKNLVPSNDPGVFNLTINGTTYASNVGHNGTTGAQSVEPDTYTVGETAGTNTSLSNYTTTYGGDCNAQGQVTVGVAENKSCTITNTRKGGSITFVKEVLGGDAEPTDWEFDVLNVGTFQNGTFVFNTGTYSVTETSNVLGYSLTSVSGVCSNPNLANGSATLTVSEQGGTCTFTNTRDTGSIKVNKLLDSDANGSFETVNPASFNWSLDGVGENAMGSTVSNVTTTVAGVTHSINENTVANYHLVGWYPTASTQYSCANPQGTTLPLTVSVSKNSTTEITLCNAADEATLTVIKEVVNDNGGTKGVSDFPLFVDAQSVLSGTTNAFAFGSHTVSETNIPGYAASFSGDCDAQGSVSLASGDHKTCTITNNDIAPKLTVTKVVASGTALVSDFPLFVDQTQVGSGIQNTFNAGTYTVSETNQPGYTAVISGDCAVGGSVTLNIGDVKACTITNSRDTGSITIVKDAQPNAAQDFRFTGNLGEFYLDDDSNATLSNTKVFSNLETGTYTVTEPNDFPGTWDLESVTCIGGSDAEGNNRNAVIKLEKGENVTCTFVNVRETGSITIIKDAINNHAQDFAFSTTGGLGSFILDDDGNNNNTRSNTRVFTVSTGAYTITEANTSGWRLTNLVCNDENGSVNVQTRKATLSLEADENITCTFTNTHLAKLWGFKFNDQNVDGDWDLFDGEFGLGNWHITITGENEFEDDTYTSNFFLTRGLYEFHNLLPGDYTVCETMQDGWTNTTPLCQEVHLTPGDVDHFINFGNAHHGDLEVTKYNDKNNNGEQDQDEEVLSGWEINLGEESQVTGQDGKVLFEDITSGSYYLSETMQDGWTQTNITCDQEEDEEEQEVRSDLGYSVTIIPGQTTYCKIGNHYNAPVLMIEKSNDATSAQTAGSDVQYTIVVKLEGNDLNNVLVTDTTPTGFTYRTGSWTTNSTVRGDISGLGEPTYNSPGTWTLGDMVVGEVVTLTYIADIAGSVDAGTYKDLAWAYGTNSFDESEVLALGQNSQFVDGIFVGTDVEIKKDNQQTGSVNIENSTGEVLGASTELPATGANNIYLILAVALLLLGSLFIFGGKYMSKLLVALFVGLSVFSIAPSTYAGEEVSHLSVRMEAPLSPTRSNDWTLAFSALDRNSSQITIKCYVKKTSGDFVQFDTDKVLSDGGAGSCQVNGSVLNIQGTYSFKVTASNGSDTVESQTAVVAYDIDGPGTPTNYSKDHPSQCRWIIRFKTADDAGLTTKVEIYSSTDMSFNTNNGTRVGTVAIGSNQQGEFIHDRGSDCDKNWYYVIRAFDAIGNQSGHIGDQVNSSAVASPKSSSTPALTVENANLTNAQSTEGQGEVLGDDQADEQVEEATGLIQGAKEIAGKTLKNKAFWWILSTIAALGIIYGIFKKSKSQSN